MFAELRTQCAHPHPTLSRLHGPLAAGLGPGHRLQILLGFPLWPSCPKSLAHLFPLGLSLPLTVPCCQGQGSLGVVRDFVGCPSVGDGVWEEGCRGERFSPRPLTSGGCLAVSAPHGAGRGAAGGQLSPPREPLPFARGSLFALLESLT